MDGKWRFLLKRHDFAVPPTVAELAALEHRILAKIDILPERFIPIDISLARWALRRSWAVRSAWVVAILFVLLGFVVGRDFNDLSFPPADSATLFASADGTPWQSFITAPSSSGETDDATE